MNELEIMARYLNWDCWKCRYFLWFGDDLGSSCKKKTPEPKRLFGCEKLDPLKKREMVTIEIEFELPELDNYAKLEFNRKTK